MLNCKPWDFLIENPVEKTIDVDADALTAPLEDPTGVYLLISEIDPFEDKVSTDTLCQMVAVMLAAPEARFLIATMHPDGAAGFLSHLRPHSHKIAAYAVQYGARPDAARARTIGLEDFFVPNMGLAVTVTDQASADDRVGRLLDVPAAMHFASHAPATSGIDWTSIKPSLGSHRGLGFKLNALTGEIRDKYEQKRMSARGCLDWIFASGEGKGHFSTAHPDWFRSTARQCDRAGIPFAFGGWGSKVPYGEIGINAGVRELRAGKLCDIPSGVGETITVAVPVNDADPALVMIPRDQPGAADVGRHLDGEIRMAIPDFLKGCEA